MLAGGASEIDESIGILDGQIRARAEQLRSAEAAKVAYETQNLGLLPGVGSVSQRLAAAQSELSQIDSQLVSARSALAALNGQLAGTPPTMAVPGGGGGGGGAVAQAQGELAAMRARGFTDAHPDVIAMRSQIEQLRALGGGGRGGAGSTPNPAYAPLVSMRAERQAAVGALEARKAALTGELAQLRGRQVQEPGVAARLDELTRAYQLAKDTHDKLLADREQLRLRGNVTSATGDARFRVIDPPFLPRSPAAPNRPLLLLGVLLAAIAGGIAAAFALGQLAGSFATADRLARATGLNVIGAISRVTTPAERETAARGRQLFYGGAGALAALFVVLLAVELVVRGTVA
jgi:polysaccharide chain length determinant protein (PEP-CTERM system associated)